MEAESSNAVQAVRVKFDVEESDAMKKRRIASYSYLQKVQAEERWMNLHYKNVLVNQLSRCFYCPLNFISSFFRNLTAFYFEIRYCQI